MVKTGAWVMDGRLVPVLRLLRLFAAIVARQEHMGCLTSAGAYATPNRPASARVITMLLRLLTVFLALCVTSSVPAAAASPIYLWLEAEWFEGVSGSFA